MLISVGVLLGRGRAQRLFERAELLRRLGTAVLVMSGEAEARHSLSHICARLGAERSASGEFFRELGASLHELGESGLDELWERCARDTLAPPLTERDLSPLLRLGRALAAGECAGRSFELCSRELERLAVSAGECAERDGRVWTAMGFALGCAAAIVLV